MRKSAAAFVAANKASATADDRAPLQLVCMALALALLVLAVRIATVW